MKKTLCAMLLMLATPLLAEPTVKLRMDASPKEITIGDPIHCNITVIFSSALKPSPLLPATTGDVEVLAYPAPEVKTLPDGNVEMTHKLVLTTFSTGTLTLPAFAINFTTVEGQRVETKTQPLDIDVISLLQKHGDEGNLRPLKGPYNYRSYFWLWVLLGLALLGVAAYFLMKYLQTKKKMTLENGGRPLRPPEEIAWDALHELEDSDLRQNGLIKEYYSRLSNILRTYLEQRYRISSLERTTSELMGDLRTLNLSLETTSVARQFLESGDLVKFAKLTPSDDEIDADINRVKQFITVTTPQKTQEPEKIPV